MVSLIKSLLTFHFIHSIQSSAYISFVLHIGHSDETRPIILKKGRTPCISAKEGKKGEDRVYLWKKNSKERKDVRKPRMKEEMCWLSFLAIIILTYNRETVRETNCKR